MRRRFRQTYEQTPPSNKPILRWYKQFKDTESVHIQKSPGRPKTSEENVERLRQSCFRSPKKSIARRSLELGIPKTTIQNVIYKRLRLHTYKIQLRHQNKPADQPKRVDYASEMLNRIDNDPNLTKLFLGSHRNLQIR